MTRKVLALGRDGQLVLRSADGNVQPIPKPQAAASALLLIDCSSSMSGPKISQAKDGVLSFADEAARKGYAVGLISFASEAKMLCDPQQNVPAVAAAVRYLDASGSTNMADGLILAIEQIGGRSGSRAIVMVTDGEPDNRDAAIGAARRAKELGIDIITIGVDGADQDFLRLLATRSDLATFVSAKELRIGIADAAKMLSGATSRSK